LILGAINRKANEHISTFKMPIDIKDTKVYEHIKNTIGINDFTCFYYKNEYEDEYFSFVPKIWTRLITPITGICPSD